MGPSATESVAVVGDVHGHLQLALCILARWQRELESPFVAVLLCGDVGTFTDRAQLDNATVAHARQNPCELEFLTLWAATPAAPWLERIFMPLGEGLGLQCPVVMVHGNHEGFAVLEPFSRSGPPAVPVAVADLPALDAKGRLRYLPSGWRFRTPGGRVVGGVGGIEPGQRGADYHPLAYVDEDAVISLAACEPVDVLVTHQGPAAVQGEAGSATLDLLAERPSARVWCHGHGASEWEVTRVGPAGECQVVPLGDIAFPGRGPSMGNPGLDGWCHLTLNRHEEPALRREAPPFWRDYRRSRWRPTREGALVCPDLVPFVDRRRLA